MPHEVHNASWEHNINLTYVSVGDVSLWCKFCDIFVQINIFQTESSFFKRPLILVFISITNSETQRHCKCTSLWRCCIHSRIYLQTRGLNSTHSCARTAAEPVCVSARSPPNPHEGLTQESEQNHGGKNLRANPVFK